MILVDRYIENGMVTMMSSHFDHLGRSIKDEVVMNFSSIVSESDIDSYYRNRRGSDYIIDMVLFNNEVPSAMVDEFVVLVYFSDTELEPSILDVKKNGDTWEITGYR